MSNRPGTTQIHLRLPNALLKKLDKLAKQERRTRTAAIVVLLEEGIEDAKKQTRK